MKNEKGFTLIEMGSFILLLLALPILIIFVTTYMVTTSPELAINMLNHRGYIVLAAGEYEDIITHLDLIGTSADAAVIAAEDAVTAAEEAVDAAEIAAAKVDLFNTAEVFLFPSTTGVTVTLTAGNTNAWSAWAEVVDSTAVTLSSKFAASPGYINDLYVFDHSAVDKIYCIELAYGASKTPLARVMWHTSFIDVAMVKSRGVPAGETIYYRMMCSGANLATAKVGFRYFFE